MAKRLLLNFKKDWTIGFRNFYLAITIATAVLFYLFLTFLIPEDYSPVNLYLYTDPLYREALQNGEESEFEVMEMDSPEAVYESMKKDVNGYGFIVQQGETAPDITIVSQGGEESETANLLKLSLGTAFTEYLMTGQEYAIDYDVVTLHPGMEKVSYQDNFLPIFIVMESSFIGFFLISVMLFMEKDQRMHTAYLVSPGGLTEHLLSKVLVMLLLGYVSAFGITLAVRGFDANFYRLWLTVTVSSFLSSSLGLLMGAIFNSLQKAMFLLLSFVFLLMMPVLSFAFPVFTPGWIKFLPTYPMLQAARSAVIPAFGAAGFYKNIAVIAGEGTILFIMSRLLYSRSLRATS